MPVWLLLALAAAVLTAGRDGFLKAAGEGLHAYGLAVLVYGGGALLLLPVVVLGGISRPDPSFWWALGVSGGINALANVLLIRALVLTDLSLVSPLKGLTPVFMLATGPLVLGELPGPGGALGVTLVVVGGWVLSRRGPGLLEPFRALAADRGARLTLLVATLYSVSAVVDKVGVLASTPLLWAFALHATSAALVLPLAIRKGGMRPGRMLPVVAAAGASAVAVAAQMTALTLTLAAFVIAVKRTSILFGVLFGAAFFGEARAGRRLVGATVMLAGLVLLTLG